VQVLISLSSSISLQLFDLLQENEAWKPIWDTSWPQWQFCFH